MNWNNWATVSSALLVIFIIIAIFVAIKRPHLNIFTSRNVLIAGTYLSSAILIYPLYRVELSVLNSILLSAQHAIRLFAFDDNYFEAIGTAGGLTEFYMVILATLYIFAPMLSVTVIISLFKNLWAYLRYKFNFYKDIHVFSELNEKTLALGKSIYDKYNKVNGKYTSIRKAMIVYADIIDKNEESHLELVEAAEKIGAIFFRKDLATINFNNWGIFRWYNRKLNFYLISDDEQEKVRHTESVISYYKNDPQCKLFVFSDNLESKCFLDSYSKEHKAGLKMQVVRVNDVRALIYHNLNSNGIKLFENANTLAGGSREISAVVVGMGKYGIEVIKSLLWYCQLPGYRIKITVFDERHDAKSRFKAICPEITTGKKIDTLGDMRYTVDFREVSFGTDKFYSEMKSIDDITYIFVCLGTDKQNIAAANGIRSRLAKKDRVPRIETILYDSALKRRLSSVWSEQNIFAIGDLEGFYSEGTVINSSLIDEALKVHTRWDNSANPENNFYMNDYNYCSSMASALHRILRKSIISYADGKEEIFPFYYSNDTNILPEVNMNLLKEIFPLINDNENIKALSLKMCAFADFLYIKLAHIHYAKLTVSERKEVLENLKLYLKEKGIESDILMLNDTDKYIKGYDEYIENIDSAANKKVSRSLFDSIVKVRTKAMIDETEKRSAVHSFEYYSLSPEEKAEVRKYVKRHIENMTDKSFDDYIEYTKCFAYIEHIRWNAYMRTEGFQRAIKTNKSYNLHYDLVPVELLTLADCVKDI